MSHNKVLFTEYKLFHAANPHIMDALIQFFDQQVRSGHNDLRIAHGTEYIRHLKRSLTAPNLRYRVPNSHRTYYAEALNKMDQFAGMFKMGFRRSEFVAVDHKHTLKIIRFVVRPFGYNAVTLDTTTTSHHILLVPWTKKREHVIEVVMQALAVHTGARLNIVNGRTLVLAKNPNGRIRCRLHQKKDASVFDEQFIDVSFLKDSS